MSDKTITEIDNCPRIATTEQLRGFDTKAIANGFAAYLEIGEMDVLEPQGQHVGHVDGMNEDGSYRVHWLAQVKGRSTPAVGYIDVLPTDFSSLPSCEDVFPAFKDALAALLGGAVPSSVL